MGGTLSTRLKSLTAHQKAECLQGLHITLKSPAVKNISIPELHLDNPRVCSNFMALLIGKSLHGVPVASVSCHHPMPCEAGIDALRGIDRPAARSAVTFYETKRPLERYADAAVPWRSMVTEMWFLSALESASKQTDAEESGSGYNKWGPEGAVRGAARIVPSDADMATFENIIKYVHDGIVKPDKWRSCVIKPSFVLDTDTRPAASDLLVNGNTLFDVRCTTRDMTRKRDTTGTTLSKSFEELALLRLMAQTIIYNKNNESKKMIKSVGFIMPFQHAYGTVSLDKWDPVPLERYLRINEGNKGKK
eukprot:PhM_4_TR7771/c0_g1_i1/m.91392